MPGGHTQHPSKTRHVPRDARGVSCARVELVPSVCDSSHERLVQQPEGCLAGYVRQWSVSLLQQELGDLDGVGGGTLADVVGNAPEVDPIGDGEVTTEPANVDVVRPRCLSGKGIYVVGRVIADHQTRSGSPGLAYLVKVEGTGKLHVDRLGVG